MNATDADSLDDDDRDGLGSHGQPIDLADRLKTIQDVKAALAEADRGEGMNADEFFAGLPSLGEADSVGSGGAAFGEEGSLEGKLSNIAADLLSYRHYEAFVRRVFDSPTGLWLSVSTCCAGLATLPDFAAEVFAEHAESFVVAYLPWPCLPDGDPYGPDALRSRGYDLVHDSVVQSRRTWVRINSLCRRPEPPQRFS